MVDDTFLETWQVSLSTSESLTITLNGAFDTYVFLVDESSCLVIDENDDCSEGVPSRSCLNVSLASGVYLVGASAYEAGQEGAYTLELQCGAITPPFHRGDADNNGQLEITDAVRILGFLFLGQAIPTCMDAGDADDNGQLELTDAVRVLGYLFLGQAPPSAPGPPGSSCGSDPTPADNGTDLGCSAYSGC